MTILKSLLFLALGAGLVWFSLGSVSAEQRGEIWESFFQVEWIWLILSMSFGLLSHLSRSHRWQMMLEPLGHKPSYWNCFLILMVGYFGNLAINRLGEAMRIGFMTRYEGIPADKVFGTIVADRAIDVFSLLLVFAATMFLYGDLLGSYVQENLIPLYQSKLSGLFSGSFALIAGLGLVLLAVAFFLMRKWFQDLPKKLFKIAKSIWEGIISVKDVKNMPLFIAHSIFIWVMYWAMIYICLQALPETADLGPGVGLVLLSFGTFAMIATPGRIGAYPIMVSLTLGFFGILASSATALGWVIWSTQTALVVLCGLACYLALTYLVVPRELAVND